MWIFTPRGFFSAVEDPENTEYVYVRTRHIKDLHALGDLLDVEPFQLKRVSDYPWRIYVSKRDWAMACAAMALEIDYNNHKNAVKERDPERAKLYGRVWGVMLDAEEHPRPEQRKGQRFMDFADLDPIERRDALDEEQRRELFGKGR